MAMLMAYCAAIGNLAAPNERLCFVWVKAECLFVRADISAMMGFGSKQLRSVMGNCISSIKITLFVQIVDIPYMRGANKIQGGDS